MNKRQKSIFPTLLSKIDKIRSSSPSEDRKKELNELIEYIQQSKDKDQIAQLNFICTHNSRRSQLGQIWSQLAAYYYNIPAQCYSGGTEITAFNWRAVKAVETAGFKISKLGNENPLYEIFFGEGIPSFKAFSKLYDDMNNPKNDFSAIMTCSHADQNCPHIPGATKRIPIRYEDPKAFDDTELEEEKYTERSDQIAMEMFYVFSKIK
ncbi:low molecular weight phosphatase family protein [Echinicola salinicaeni]|uniref:protein-tyrosine-phosphatase n=1 Tax=Echinicola salinicaeni TaxID=2762757 RepID=UPI001644B29F|nr:protein-tyrosine-phosphatase [Echinicola salinicaeni]